MKKRIFIVIPAVLVVAALIFYFRFWQNRNNQGARIPISGNIEATTVDVSFKIPGKIEQLLVEEGDFVKTGQLIAVLEHKDLLAQKAKAEASLEAAQSRLPTLRKNIEFQDKSSTQEIFQAEAAVQAAESRLQQLLSGSRPQEVRAAKADVDQTLADIE